MSTRAFCRIVKNELFPKRKFQCQNFVRCGHGEWNYRTGTKHPTTPLGFMATNFIMTFAWWWVLWHCFDEYEHIIGLPYPDPSQWTDEELGIPSDDDKEKQKDQDKEEERMTTSKSRQC